MACAHPALTSCRCASLAQARNQKGSARLSATLQNIPAMASWNERVASMRQRIESLLQDDGDVIGDALVSAGDAAVQRWLLVGRTAEDLVDVTATGTFLSRVVPNAAPVQAAPPVPLKAPPPVKSSPPLRQNTSLDQTTGLQVPTLTTQPTQVSAARTDNLEQVTSPGTTRAQLSTQTWPGAVPGAGSILPRNAVSKTHSLLSQPTSLLSLARSLSFSRTQSQDCVRWLRGGAEICSRCRMPSERRDSCHQEEFLISSSRCTRVHRPG